VKKVISILLALGLVLGLTVAAPAVSGQCDTSLSNCAVVVVPNVECTATAVYNITFTTNRPLASGIDHIIVTFPTGSNASAAAAQIGGVGVGVTYVGDTVVYVNIPAGGIPAGSAVRLDISNVVNPTVGSYKLLLRTNVDDCDCEAPFAIVAGGSISPTSAVWCPCHNVTTTITWGGSTNITAVNGWAWGVGLWAVVGNTLSINCSAMAGLGLNACAVIPIQIDFDPGCNVTLTVTVADNATVPLVAGWNLMSLPIMPIDTAITAVLATIDTNVKCVWYYDGCEDAWYAYKNGAGADFGLTTMEAGKAYWVEMTAAATLNLCGYKLPCPPKGPPCYCYCHCWNMVGFHRTTSLNLSDYLANLNPAGSLFGALTWTGATGWQTVTASTMLNPGQGYWMAFMTNACFAPPV
jgi:hypothetical protein